MSKPTISNSHNSHTYIQPNKACIVRVPAARGPHRNLTLLHQHVKELSPEDSQKVQALPRRQTRAGPLPVIRVAVSQYQACPSPCPCPFSGLLAGLPCVDAAVSTLLRPTPEQPSPAGQRNRALPRPLGVHQAPIPCLQTYRQRLAYHLCRRLSLTAGRSTIRP